MGLPQNRSVFIKAYIRMNLGDDLFVKILCDRYPRVIFKIVCLAKYVNALKKIPNLKTIKYVLILDRVLDVLKIGFNMRTMLEKRITKNSSCFVFIGGSIFIESPQWRSKVSQLSAILTRVQSSFIIGSNFGPFQNPSYLLEYRNIFKKLSDICFRDQFSYNLFNDLPNARYESDVIFSIDISKYLSIKPRKKALISVINLKHNPKLRSYAKVYENCIIGLANEFIRQGYVVSLMGFCRAEGDERIIKRLLKSGMFSQIDNVSSYIYSGDIDEALIQFQEAECVIATRFHAVILGFLFQKKVFPIIYSDKTLNFLYDMGYAGKKCKVEEVNNIQPMDVINHLINSTSLNISKEVVSSNKQFIKLDEYLGTIGSMTKLVSD